MGEDICYVRYLRGGGVCGRRDCDQGFWGVQYLGSVRRYFALCHIWWERIFVTREEPPVLSTVLLDKVRVIFYVADCPAVFVEKYK